VWAKPLTSNPTLGTTGPSVVAALGWLFVPDDKSVYVVTPDGQIQMYAMGESVSRSLVQGGGGCFRPFTTVHFWCLTTRPKHQLRS
jgi:hypothetical protein